MEALVVIVNTLCHASGTEHAVYYFNLPSGSSNITPTISLLTTGCFVMTVKAHCKHFLTKILKIALCENCISRIRNILFEVRL